MRVSIAILASLFALVTVPARADWMYKVNEPDVFGNRTVFAAGKGSLGGTLVIRCDQEQLSLGYIQKKKEFDDIPTLPAQLFIQTDTSSPTKLEVKSGNWNDDDSGFTTEDRNAQILAVLRAISTAQRAIKVGVVLGGQKWTDTIDVTSSTAAMNAAIKNCNLDQIKS